VSASRVAESVTAAVRELMLAAAVSDVNALQMLAAKRLIERATDCLAEQTLPIGRRYALDREAIARTRAGRPWQVFSHNPLGIPLRIVVDGSTAAATIQTSTLYDGMPGHLHGGFAAAMLDALLSTLVQAQDLRAVTVALKVQFLVAAPTGGQLEIEGVVTYVEGRKVIAQGRIRQGQNTVVTGEALFITIAGEPD
jgi:acyl-coenzyme A thioesterase PaaI-like protein